MGSSGNHSAHNKEMAEEENRVTEIASKKRRRGGGDDYNVILRNGHCESRSPNDKKIV